MYNNESLSTCRPRYCFTNLSFNLKKKKYITTHHSFLGIILHNNIIMVDWYLTCAVTFVAYCARLNDIGSGGKRWRANNTGGKRNYNDDSKKLNRPGKTPNCVSVFWCEPSENANARRPDDGEQIGTRSDAFGRMTLTAYTIYVAIPHGTASATIVERGRGNASWILSCRPRAHCPVFPTAAVDFSAGPTTTAKTAATGRLPRTRTPVRPLPPPPNALVPPSQKSCPSPLVPRATRRFRRVRNGGRGGYWLSRPTRNRSHVLYHRAAWRARE